MRKFILTALLACLPALAQLPAQRQFLLRIAPVRADFTFQNMTAEERRLAGEHAQYLRSLLSEGKITMAGQALDPKGLWGITIANAPDAETAKSLLENDPAVKGKFFRGEVVPFRTVFERPCEQPPKP